MGTEALGISVLAILSFGTGWTIRGWIADKEHAYRWWRTGCRHNIEERWRGSDGH